MQIADLAAGSNNAVMGILAAVIYRNSTGKGQHIDISMTDGMIAFTGYYGAGFLVDGKNLELEGGLTYGGSLYDYYRTKDGQYIAFGGLEPQFYTNFFKVINRPDLIPGGVMPDNVYEVKKEIRTIILTKTKDEWMILFNATDACVEPVMTFSEVFSDALVKERGMVVEVPLPNGGTVRQVAFPIKFSESQPSYRRVGVSIKSGTHTKEVCRELGYSENEIEEFERTGLFS
jgi:crotonobetainyl-CoA:carnitine CoA-transferase CaiB-like acyl-CoA transferase